MYPNNQNITPAIENNPIFFAHITDTLFDVTIPDSSIAKPAAINITKNPQTKNKNVLNIKLTSAETVVSALLDVVKAINKINGIKVFSLDILTPFLKLLLKKKMITIDIAENQLCSN